MINLIPDNDKRIIRAARRNVVLFRYFLLFLALLIFTAGTYGYGLFVSVIDKSSAETTQRENQAKANTAQYNQIKSDGKEFSDNLAAAKTLSNGQISYSSIIIQITNAIPAGAIMTDLTLNAGSFDQPTTLTFKAASYDAILTLKQSLEDSPIVSDVSIASTQRDAASDEPLPYPYSVTLNATITLPTATEGAAR